MTHLSLTVKHCYGRSDYTPRITHLWPLIYNKNKTAPKMTVKYINIAISSVVSQIKFHILLTLLFVDIPK